MTEENPEHREVAADSAPQETTMDTKDADNMETPSVSAEKPLEEGVMTNRGHKPLDSETPSPIKAPRCGPINEEQVERDFLDYANYRNGISASTGTPTSTNTGNMERGLTLIESRLLYTYWGDFVKSGSEEDINEILKLPSKLSTASMNMSVRNSLAALPLTALSASLMEIIEGEQAYMKDLYRVAEMLNLSLAALDSKSLGLDDIPTESMIDGHEAHTPLLHSSFEELSEEVIKEMEAYLAELAIVRDKLNVSAHYAHVIARFLIKRHKDHVKKRQAHNVLAHGIKADPIAVDE